MKGVYNGLYLSNPLPAALFKLFYKKRIPIFLLSQFILCVLSSEGIHSVPTVRVLRQCNRTQGEENRGSLKSIQRNIKQTIAF